MGHTEFLGVGPRKGGHSLRFNEYGSEIWAWGVEGSLEEVGFTLNWTWTGDFFFDLNLGFCENH